VQDSNVNRCALVMLIDNSSCRIFRLDRDNPTGEILEALEGMA
jgi:hypothetical protein